LNLVSCKAKEQDTMFDLKSASGYGITSSPVLGKGQRNRSIALQALDDYREATFMGSLHRLASFVTRHSNKLLSLSEVTAQHKVKSQYYSGIRAVPIARIRGSEARSDDFDADFCPTQTHTKDRWMRIAMARQLGTALPAVQLIQVGDDYFVRDGHHRISVARTLGEEYLDAEVIVWQVAEQSHVSQPACTCELAARSLS
jgi:hypothetical protein